MSAKKAAATAETPSPAAPSNWSSPGRWVLLLTIWGAAGAGLWFTGWEHVHKHVMTSPEYRLDPRNIEITPPAPWIHTDVRAEVVRNASLDSSLSLLDEQLTLQIAQAFAAHPWVAKVTRVSKYYPARVQVELVYREPVAMVEVTGGLLPVDSEGILLPSDDFSTAEARKFPRLADIKTVPIGPQGTRWGDARVAGGAKLAALLLDDWRNWNLARVVPTVPPAGVRTTDDISYELVSQSGMRILWGHAPGSERAGDATAADKLDRLRQYVAQNGGLDGSSGAVLDVRSGRDAILPSRAAIKPLPPRTPRTATQ